MDGARPRAVPGKKKLPEYYAANSENKIILPQIIVTQPR
jgi:hypothetical protein